MEVLESSIVCRISRVVHLSIICLKIQKLSISELEAAFKRAKAAGRTYLISIKVQQHQWTPGDAWWDVGVPEVSQRKEVRLAYADHSEGQKKQRIGV
jgi:3D-(3,5/4)-trihydroxycyclohexane-1,2-dione acylhydrolase (decyclizing)